MALDHLGASYGMFMQLGRLDAISIVGIHFGQLLLAMADDGGDEATKKTAVEILERSRQGLPQLGQVDLARQLEVFLGQVS